MNEYEIYTIYLTHSIWSFIHCCLPSTHIVRHGIKELMVELPTEALTDLSPIIVQNNNNYSHDSQFQVSKWL